jgi:transcriptional regulator with XRE-family HTH domain
MHLTNMKRERTRAGLTQVAVGQRMGTTQGRVTTIEGGASVRPETAERVAAAIGCRVEDLVQETEPVITLRLSELSPEQIAVLTGSK